MTAPAAATAHQGRVFYGWYVLGASVVIELFGLGFGIFAITTVYPFIIDTFPTWSRTVVFLPTSVIIMTVAAMGPLVGAWIDRHSLRVVFALGILVQSVALYLFSLIQTPTQYLAVSFLLGVGMSGVTILPNQVLVSRWFFERVGLVNGVILAATALGAAISPALLTRLIEASDWRAAFVWMAVGAAVFPLLAVGLVVRDRPEDLGLQPYGARRDPVAATAQMQGVTVRQALRAPVFWAFGAAVFVGGMPCYSYNKHILVLLKDLGYAPVPAADYKSLLFLVSACARLSFGWLCDYFDRRRLVLIHFTMIGIGSLLFLGVPYDSRLLVPCLLVFGVGYGGLLPAIPILTLSYFGRAHLGAILGVYKISYDIAAASAPLLTAELYERFGSYAVAQQVLAVCAWIGVALVAVGLPRVPLARVGRDNKDS
jgi:MFS family permease